MQDGKEQERIRRAQSGIERRKKMGEQEVNPRFTPYNTMFKLQTSTTELHPRSLECVHCGHLLDWRLYSVAPVEFDRECHRCSIRSEDFWKDKPHRKVENHNAKG